MPARAIPRTGEWPVKHRCASRAQPPMAERLVATFSIEAADKKEIAHGQGDRLVQYRLGNGFPIVEQRHVRLKTRPLAKSHAGVPDRGVEYGMKSHQCSRAFTAAQNQWMIIASPEAQYPIERDVETGRSNGRRRLHDSGKDTRRKGLICPDPNERDMQHRTRLSLQSKTVSQLPCELRDARGGGRISQQRKKHAVAL